MWSMRVELKRRHKNKLDDLKVYMGQVPSYKVLLPPDTMLSGPDWT